MMSFSAVFQWVPGDEAGMSRFLLEHYTEHQQFYRTLLEASPSVVTVALPIQRLESWEAWLGAHQEMTQSVWSGLGGGQSQDFSRLKYDDPGAMQDWMNRHAAWHSVVRDALSL